MEWAEEEEESIFSLQAGMKGRGRTTQRAENKETETMYSAHPDGLLILWLLSRGGGIYALTHRQNPV